MMLMPLSFYLAPLQHIMNTTMEKNNKSKIIEKEYKGGREEPKKFPSKRHSYTVRNMFACMDECI